MNLARAMEIERSIRVKDQIREILIMDWDPIDVKDETSAADEYDMYITGIYELLKDNASANTISDHLRQIEIRHMGFSNEQAPERLLAANRLKRISLAYRLRDNRPPIA